MENGQQIKVWHTTQMCCIRTQSLLFPEKEGVLRRRSDWIKRTGDSTNIRDPKTPTPSILVSLFSVTMTVVESNTISHALLLTVMDCKLKTYTSFRTNSLFINVRIPIYKEMDITYIWYVWVCRYIEPYLLNNLPYSFIILYIISLSIKFFTRVYQISIWFFLKNTIRHN